MRKDLDAARNDALQLRATEQEGDHLRRELDSALQRLLERPRVVLAIDEPLGGTVPSYSAAMTAACAASLPPRTCPTSVLRLGKRQPPSDVLH